MKGPVGPTRKEARENLIKGLAACARLVDACQKYNARTARTEAGLARQKKVGLIQELADEDLSGIRATLDQVDMIPDDKLSEMTWNKVWERSRMIEIHVDTASIRSKRQAASPAPSTSWAMRDSSRRRRRCRQSTRTRSGAERKKKA